MILTFVCLTVCRDLPPIDLLKLDSSIQGGFAFKKAYSKTGNVVTYTRDADQSGLVIAALSTDDNLTVEENWNKVAFSAQYDPERPQTPRSGLPLADKCADARSNHGGLLYFMTGRLLLYVNLTGYAVTESDYQLQEGAARYAVAKVRGLYSRATGDATVYGHRVSGCRTGPSGDVLLPLDGWAAAAGVEITWNKVRGTASFNYSGLDYVFPLGSTKLKKGSEWQDCPDTLLWHGGHWYVPLRLVSK